MMRAAFQQLMSGMAHGEQSWVASFGLRAIGLVLLGLCTLAGRWTGMLVHAGGQARQIAALAPAVLAVICWSGGWALTVLGPRLFRLMSPPPRPFY